MTDDGADDNCDSCPQPRTIPTLTLYDVDIERARDLRMELAKVRCWITGFEAAGKSGPPGADSLRQLQVLLTNAISKAAFSKD